MGKATQDLRKEHNAILHVLKILDKMMLTETKEESIKLQDYSELAHFLGIFADKCHHGKEENYLFQELVSIGYANVCGPVGAMLQEHKQGREYLSLMNKALELKDLASFNIAAAQYGTLLKSHIEKENNVLLVMADQLLDEAKQDELFVKFEQYEESVIGHGVHEQLHSMIHKWATEFEVK